MVRPQAGRRQLEHMAVGIAEIEALATALPAHPPFDRNPLLLQSLVPEGEFGDLYSEADMQGAVPVMRRDDSRRRIAF